MRTLATSSVVALFLVAAVPLIGCPPPKNSSQAPAAAAPAQQPPQGQYPAQGQYPQQAPPPGYAQQPQPGYAQQPAPAPAGYPQQPAPQPAPTTPLPAPGQPGAAPPAGGQMATPGPLALPCQNDQACGLAHCNTQFGKCAFPCQSAVDCIQGASCNALTGFCLPGGG